MDIGFSNNMKITRAEATLTEIQTNGFSVWGGYEGNTVFDGRKVTYDNSNSEWGYENTEYWTYNIYDFHDKFLFSFKMMVVHLGFEPRLKRV